MVTPQQAVLAAELFAGIGPTRHRMLSFAGSLNVLVALDAYDMRKGFNGLPAPGLLAYVLVMKYCDHLSLYWQE